MSNLSRIYLERVEKCILSGIPVENMNMTIRQKFRTRMTCEAYRIWMANKQIRVREVMERIAAREYVFLAQKAQEGDKEAQEYVRELRIAPGVRRSMKEIEQDIEALNHIIGAFSAPTNYIERAKVADASDWLIREGQKMGNDKAVAAGAKIKMELNNNFEERMSAEERMSPQEINITGDVSVVKTDRVNYTEKEKESMRRKYGLTKKELEEVIQNEQGEYVDVVEEEEKDFFEDKEEL